MTIPAPGRAPAPLAGSDSFCGAISPPQDGGASYWCLGEPGHPGDHAAYGTQSDTVPVCTWPQDPEPAPAAPPLAPYAGDGGPFCEARSNGRYICLASPGHAGDHVPYGVPGSDLRKRTWPQDPETSRQGGGLSGDTVASLPGTPAAPVIRELSTGQPGYATELDGEFPDGRANMAGHAANAHSGYTCDGCGGHGSEPTHVPPCWRLYIARLRLAPAVTEARAALAAYDELAGNPRPTSAESARFRDAQVLISVHLGEVLFEIDTQAGAL